ncbi:hypothetical protein HY498_05890 [Candidatus Woesearchaeota archaeon]|nr:hypothetical protein [Candidatus Woesearchaeota archaeon]
MSFNNIIVRLSKLKYLLIFLVVAILVGWLYIGPLTNQEVYDAVGWIFAILFPILVGLIVSLQVYNLSERKTCPTSATSSGILGGIAGIITVGCPACPLILLSWVGLGAGATGGILGGPWIKLVSLVILFLAVYWASK